MRVFKDANVNWAMYRYHMCSDLLINFQYLLKYPFGKKWPVYLYHHIPKCGGETVAELLRKWFLVFRDDKPSGFRGILPFITIRRLRSYCCVHGHFHLDGYRLWERYPFVYGNNEYRIISFVRHPFNTIVSKYYYGIKTGEINTEDVSLKQFVMSEYDINDLYCMYPRRDKRFIDHMFGNRNYLANKLGCDIHNYKERLDSYFFIGILEHLNFSFQELAKRIGKSFVATNVHRNRSKYDKQYEDVSESEFRKRNELDYLIYDYVRGKLKIA